MDDAVVHDLKGGFSKTAKNFVRKSIAGGTWRNEVEFGGKISYPASVRRITYRNRLLDVRFHSSVVVDIYDEGIEISLAQFIQF